MLVIVFDYIKRKQNKIGLFALCRFYNLQIASFVEGRIQR